METVFLNNSLPRWLQALAVFTLVLLLLLLVRAGFRKKTHGTTTPSLILRLLSQLLLPAMIVTAVWIASRFLDLSATVISLLRVLLIAMLAIQAGRWADLGISHWSAQQIAKLPDDTAHRTSLRGIALIARIIIWFVAALVILQSIPNFDLSGIIASLGLGGIAIGLTAQSLVVDLLSSLIIHVDKPYEPGDSIKTGAFFGTVERIGLRSTRIRNLTGEEISISNSEMLKTPIQNFSRLEERRVSFTFQIANDTPPEKIARIPEWIEKASGGLENTRFSRAHFQSFAPGGLVFEVVFFVTLPDYDAMVKAQNQLNMRIYEKLQQESVRFGGLPAIQV